MALLGFELDANAIDTTSRDFDPLPAGDYEVVITQSEMRRNKAGTGAYVAMTYQVVNGKYANRLIFDNINILNASAKAQEIGHQSLAKIGKAVGVTKIVDTTALHGLPFVVRVAVRPADEARGFKAGNDVKDYFPAGTVAASAPAAAPTPPPAPQANAETPPWKR